MKSNKLHIMALLFILTLLPVLALGQYYKGVKVGVGYTGVPLKGKEAKLAKAYCTCFNNHQYTKEQRYSFFPFSEATSIKLVSFIYAANIPDFKPIYEAISPGHYKLNSQSAIESKVLTVSAIDSLTDILYNFDYSPVKLNFKLVSTGHNCYSPQNAVLFLDANGDVTEYMELCFSCERYFLSSSKMLGPKLCEQKYDLLKAFFLNQGLKHGTVSPDND